MFASDLFRPFLLLALSAFLVGFLGYLAMAPRPAEAWSPGPATLSSVETSNVWNFEKEI